MYLGTYSVERPRVSSYRLNAVIGLLRSIVLQVGSGRWASKELLFRLWFTDYELRMRPNASHLARKL
jgi:hypothetical protein